MCVSESTETLTFLFTDKKEGGEMKALTPLKAIRAKCLDCCCDNTREVRECPITSCPIWPFRMGKKPVVDELVDEAVLS